VVLLSPWFRVGWGSEVLLEQAQLNFGFRNKFIIVLPCGLLVDSNTFLKIVFLKCVTVYTEDAGYKKRKECVLIIIIIIIIIIIKSKAMKSSLCW